MTSGEESGGADLPKRVTVRGGRQAERSAASRSVPSAADLYVSGSYGETLLRSLMRAQLGVALGVLLPAAAVVVTFPILSVLFPSLIRMSFLTIPLTVLVLGFGIYPPLVVLALLYVRRAARVEERFVALLEDQ